MTAFTQILRRRLGFFIGTLAGAGLAALLLRDSFEEWAWKSFWMVVGSAIGFLILYGFRLRRMRKDQLPDR